MADEHVSHGWGGRSNGALSPYGEERALARVSNHRGPAVDPGPALRDACCAGSSGWGDRVCSIVAQCLSDRHGRTCSGHLRLDARYRERGCPGLRLAEAASAAQAGQARAWRLRPCQVPRNTPVWPPAAPSV